MHAALSAGARFGRYTLLRPLAVGGMAEIYLARVDGIGNFAKQVVLKRILPQFAQHDEFVEMFLHEARLAAGLQHPNVVQVFDIGEIDGDYFFTMEYVHGHDLRSVLKKARQDSERLPIQHALAFVSEAAAGLHHAHEHVDENGRPLAIVHRDVSPSNIMVSFDGAVKVADFGIAKAASQTVETRAGTLKGKISYMSPEQCRGDVLDRRSDVFALGIVLHELITGKKTFSSENEYAVIRQIIEEDAPRLSAVVGTEIPPGLDEIAARALARDRDARYATAQELQVALETLAREQRLDGSSVGRAHYLRQLFGTPPAGVAIPTPTPAKVPQTSSDVASDVPTKPLRAKETASTSIEQPRPQPSRARLRWVVAAALVVATGGGVTAVSLRDSHTAAPARSPTSPPSTAVVTPEPAPPAAATTQPATAQAPAPPAPAPATAPSQTPPVASKPSTPARASRVTSRKQPAGKGPSTTACDSWTPDSFEPPPPGCKPDHGQ